MLNVKGSIKVHKKFSKDLIRGSEQELEIRLPVPRVTSGVNPLFGDQTRELDVTGTMKGPFKCIWYDSLSARSIGGVTGFEQNVERLVGQYRDATTFVELWLEDVLVDIADVNGLTWFDKAQEIIYLNRSYQFLGEVRAGLATSAPYIIMVMLKGGVGNVAR